ncbi:UDP-phosphate galactose phosphotransferase [Caviibacterium pharyngocola]|uniref:UDP-phosphate galactose phosphotransferase n=2 Tax=Caviibacterium pharyngocola TaxID=28159 RepID=A0A2M8RXD0_9PAST|nr:UDP-phosphate galactose phosphotransferase [Caviibacterium pharyngocola]
MLAVSVRKSLNLFFDVPVIGYSYITFGGVYVTLILMLIYFGVYTKRFDFWHESRIILKSCFLSFVMLFAGLALGQYAEFYSRSTLILIFIFSSITIPLSKLFVKKFLFKLGFWQKPAKVISNNEEFKNQLFEDRYLGYVKVQGLERGTIFIDGQSIDKEKLNRIIEKNIKNSRKIIFTPVLSGYDFSHSYIYNMFNSRTNIFTLENELLSKYNKFIKSVLDYSLTLLSSILWIPLLVVIAIWIKLDDPKGKVFFKQKRLGLDGKEFMCYKFRSMYSDQSFMEQWLKDNPDEKAYYDKYHKYINDPRVTRSGSFLRKTSLDEIPQLLNVLKGEMSIVGPRPYMVSEKDDIGSKSSLVLAVKPGITGLWQVSGRSEVDFDSRVDIDVWYMKNWSLWNDIVILLKTIATVLGRNGAY